MEAGRHRESLRGTVDVERHYGRFGGTVGCWGALWSTMEGWEHYGSWEALWVVRGNAVHYKRLGGTMEAGRQ